MHVIIALRHKGTFVLLNYLLERSSVATEEGTNGLWRRTLTWYGPFACVFCHWCIDFALESGHSTVMGDDATSTRGGALPAALRNVPGIRQAADLFATPFGQQLPAQLALVLCIVVVVRVFVKPVHAQAQLLGVDENSNSGGMTVRLSAEWVVSSITAPFSALIAICVWALFLLLDGAAVPGATPPLFFLFSFFVYFSIFRFDDLEDRLHNPSCELKSLCCHSHRILQVVSFLSREMPSCRLGVVTLGFNIVRSR